MASTDCIWNQDLQDFEDCCIWAYKKCVGKCESYDPRQTGILIHIKTEKCPECSGVGCGTVPETEEEKKRNLIPL